MEESINSRLIPQKIREKFTLPEGILIMRLYELAATEWETKHRHHKSWEPFIRTSRELMDDKFVSSGVISEFRKQIKRGEVPFLTTSMERVSKRTRRTVCCYTFNKAAFDAFCGIRQQKANSLADYPGKPKLPELITYKEMQRMIKKGRFFNRLKVLVNFLRRRLTGQMFRNTALYYRKDVERLIKRSQGQCRIIVLTKQFPLSTKRNKTKGE